jgi:hypothetical protein
MRGITFGSFSLAEPSRERRSDSTEPRLFAEPASWPVEEPEIADAEALSASAAAEGEAFPEFPAESQAAATSPMVSAPDVRLAPATAGFPPTTLFYSALIGLVAILTIGAFFGVGYLLLAPPDKVTSAALTPISHPPAPRSRASTLASAPAKPPAANPTPTAASPAPTVSPAAGPAPHPVAVAAAAPKPAAKAPPATGESLATGESPPPVEAVPAAVAVAPPLPEFPVPPQKPPAPAAAATAAAIGPQSPAAQAAIGNAAGSSPRHHRRLAERRRAWRHGHARSAHLDHPREAPQPRIAHPTNPSEAGQSQAFDQLLTQLTGPARPEGQSAASPASAPASLTPPAPGQPNPFAEGGGGR